MIKLKRIYDEALPDDGRRIYVDRLWPRGLKNEKAKIDEWAKEIAPSDALRKWFGHDPSKFAEFKKRYLKELEPKSEILVKIRKEGEKKALPCCFLQKTQSIIMPSC